MKKNKIYSLRSLTATAVLTLIIGSAASVSAETITKNCPFSCRSLGLTREDGCKDYREGNRCVVKTEGGSVSSDDNNNNNSSSGGSKICLTTAGKFRVKGQCKSSRGEVELTSEGLTALSDIAIAGVPSGQTVTGAIGGNVLSSSGTWSTDSSFGFKPTVALGSADIIVASTSQLSSGCGGIATNCLSSEEVSTTSVCTGTALNPTAPAGKLCVYQLNVINSNQIRAFALPETGSNSGFSLSWNVITSGASGVDAVWAYTAQ